MRLVSGLLLLALAAPASAADAPQLLRNINTSRAGVGSRPAISGILPGGKALISTRIGSSSAPVEQLWVTDGSSAGTVPIAPTAVRSRSLRVNGRLYFDQRVAPYLWSTDGTVAGTVGVTANQGFDPVPLTALGNRLFFNATVSGVRHVYSYDTENPSSGVVDLMGSGASNWEYHSEFTIAGSKFYFVVRNSDGVQYQIWVSNGSPADARPVADPWGAGALRTDALRRPHAIRQVGNVLLYLSSDRVWNDRLWGIDIATDTLFAVTTPSGTPGSGPPVAATGSELFAFDTFALLIGGRLSSAPGMTVWRSDGTSAGTAPVIDIDVRMSTAPRKVGARLVFVADDGQHGSELWSSDGTLAGTTSLGITVPTISVTQDAIAPLGTRGSTAYFALATGTDAANWNLWRTDGTVAGTRQITAIPQFNWPMPFSDRSTLRANGDDLTVYFELPSSSTTRALYKFEPTSDQATLLRGSLALGVGAPAVYDSGLLYFTNKSRSTGDEPWISDGTPAGTRQIADLAPQSQTQDVGSRPDDFTEFGGRLAFVATDLEHGRELWTSDGTSAGTAVLADLAPGPDSSDPRQLFVFGGALHFFANDAGGTMQFWRLAADGIPRPLAALSSHLPRQASPDFARCRDAPVVLNGQLYFAGNDGQNGLELWTTDGTESGTRLVKDLVPGVRANGTPIDSAPCNLTTFGNRLYFLAGHALDDGSLRTYLWVSDGTAAGTTPIVDLPANLMFAGANGLYAFLTDQISVIAWKSDGTAAGTAQLLGDSNGEFDTQRSLIAIGSLNGRFLFGSTPGFPSGGLWTSDGTPSGTDRVADFSPRAATIRGGLAYFDAPGSNLWVSDGRVGGTRVLTKVDPTGVASFNWFENFNGVTLFETKSDGRQLWRTDGTAEGTTLIADISPLDADPTDPLDLVYSSAAKQRLVIGSTFFLAVAGDVDTGTELYALTAVDLPPTPPAPPSAGTSRGGGGVTDAFLVVVLLLFGAARVRKLEVPGEKSRGN